MTRKTALDLSPRSDTAHSDRLFLGSVGERLWALLSQGRFKSGVNRIVAHDLQHIICLRPRLLICRMGIMTSSHLTVLVNGLGEIKVLKVPWQAHGMPSINKQWPLVVVLLS